MTIDEVAALTLARIASDINRRLDRWHGRCFDVTAEIIRHYQIAGAQRWVIASSDPRSAQTYHVVVQGPDDRILDALYGEMRMGLDVSMSADERPFLGTKQQWGRANGFDAEDGYVHGTEAEDPILSSVFQSLGLRPPLDLRESLEG